MTIIWFSLLHYYTTISGFLCYFFIFKKSINISKIDALILFSLILLFVFQILNKNLNSVIIDFRFYWGWIIFYFIFKEINVSKKIIVDALALMSVLTLVETVLINTIIPPHQLPNFPDLQGGITEYRGEGYYQRPYSFGASATVGSSLLVTLMALCNVQGWRFWLSVIAVLLFVSGTGLIALFVLLLVRYRLLIIKAALPLVLILFLSATVFPEIILSINDEFLRKVGVKYIDEIIDLKFFSIVETYQQLDFYSLMFGDPDGFRGGDFGSLAFVLSNGFFGLILFLTLTVSRINRANIFPLFLILATTFHYPVIFFLPGQMILGLLLSLDKVGLLEEVDNNPKRR